MSTAKFMESADQFSRRMKAFRATLEMSQERLAESLGFSPSLIAEYETGREPSAGMLVQLGVLASRSRLYADAVYFWKLAGIEPGLMLSTSENLRAGRRAPAAPGEIARISLVRTTEKGLEKTSSHESVPAKWIESANDPRALVIDEKNAGYIFGKGDVVVFDAVSDPQSLGPLEHEVLLVKFAPLDESRRGTYGAWKRPSGYFWGKLRIKEARAAYPDIAYQATLGPLSEEFESDSVPIGWWSYDWGQPSFTIEEMAAVGKRVHRAMEEARVQVRAQIRAGADIIVVGRMLCWRTGRRAGK